jgi:Rieske Fe-S protein
MALSRRDLLCKSAAGGASFAAAGLMANCGTDEPMLVPPPKEIPATIDTNTSSPTYGQVTVSLSQNSFLKETGAAVLLRYNVPGSLPFPVPSSGLLLAHRGSATDTPEWIAVSAVCTHAACFVNYDAARKNIACPCHDGRFYAKDDASKCLGDVMSGPPTDPLQAYTVTVDAVKQQVSIDLRTPPQCGPPAMPKFQAKVVNGKVELPFAADPAVALLQTVGEEWLGVPVGWAEVLAVARVDQATVVTVTAKCPHAGCTAHYQKTPKNFRCGCHGSTFALDGKVVVGPAGTPLKSYATALMADKIVITLF